VSVISIPPAEPSDVKILYNKCSPANFYKLYSPSLVPSAALSKAPAASAASTKSFVISLVLSPKISAIAFFAYLKA